MNQTVTEIYQSRKARLTHPNGQFDSAGRWYPDEDERQECCDHVRSPSRAWPYSLMLHCRTRAHIARLVADRQARETAGVRALGEALGQIARAAQPLPRGAKAQLRRLGKALAIVGRAAWIHTVRTLEDRAAAQVSA